MTSKVLYKGQLRAESTHIKSGDTIITDAPTDNNGKGEAFSPTDLVATALASCMITVMGIKANQLNVNIDGATASIVKTMASNPRRIERVKVVLEIPSSDLSHDQKGILEKVGLSCPVAQSLHSNLEQEIHFQWK